MAIEMIGIDHSMAGIDIRMIFSFTRKRMIEALEYLKQIPGIKGSVLLSTCNRMELWVSTDQDWNGDLYDILCEIRKLNDPSYRPYFVMRKEQEAVEHLFRLASGLESRILGEDQIITQVGDALVSARECYSTDNVLETLFRQAVTVAKKIKTDVDMPATDHSVVDSAIAQLKQMGYSFAGSRCMVIGNGIMGKLAANALTAQNADVTVTVRQYHSGIVDIPAHCNRIDFGKRSEILGACDYVVSATVSPNYTLSQELVAQYCKENVVLVDLAVPRDIDPNVKNIPGVELFDIDSFRREAHSPEQMAAIGEAEALIAEQLDDFWVWYECVDLVPMIQELKGQIARDMMPRLKKEFRELPMEEDRRNKLYQDVEAAAERTMNKLLFGLKNGMERGSFRECLESLNRLYGEEE